MVSGSTPVRIVPTGTEKEDLKAEDIDNHLIPDGWIVCLVLFGVRSGRRGELQIEIRPDIFD
jgi:hypothetical protein